MTLQVGGVNISSVQVDGSDVDELRFHGNVIWNRNSDTDVVTAGCKLFDDGGHKYTLDGDVLNLIKV